MIFREGLTKKQYKGGNYLKRGAWTVCKFKSGLGKKKGGVFEAELLPPTHTLGGSCVSHPHFFCLHWITCLSIFPQSHRLNLTHYSKSSLVLAFCFLFVCMIHLAQVHPSFISLLGPQVISRD